MLSELKPAALDYYYELVEAVDPTRLQDMVNKIAPKHTEALVPFLKRYCEDPFLRDYLSDSGLAYRLNRVLARVKLPVLPDEAAEVIGKSRVLVRDELASLVGDEIYAAVS